ncbi:MAG: N-acetyltransferase [Proteobacteria bacterium]|nr:N-acetyltransferase [Pseudomonadota bacterium]MBU4469644.1 N-acetyltransferase [Pseudomonadota bacterium]MCG2751727.1 N-acetyltransferase [Desulfobacteraceae bacterium]
MIRNATIYDIKAIYGLLQEYGNLGELLPRPLSRLYDHVRDFTVFEDEKSKKVVGCCALQFCWEDLAEIRSIAVHPDYIRRKIGTELIENALKEALHYQIKKLFLLTYKPDFFKKFAFSIIDKSELPLKIWTDCITCVKYPDCDEIAMIKHL